MRVFLIVAAALCCACCTGPRPKHYADYSASSGVTLSTADASDPAVIENLDVLARVWGYVKYHHPVFADSTFNADYELFELLPQIAHAPQTGRNRLLCDWIDAFGPYDVAPERYDTLPPNRLNAYATDLGWTRDTLRLGSGLTERLQRLRFADRPDPMRYARRAYYPEYDCESPNAGFQGEDPYAGITDPDCGYRLLAVFRLWNMVEYFFPYKSLTDKSWDRVLPEYAARMISLPDGSYRRAIWRMIAETNDSHACWSAPDDVFGRNRAPLKVVFAEGRLIVADTTGQRKTALRGAFRPGDEIVAVDGLPVDYYRRQTQAYIPCSNAPRVLYETSEAILRSPYNTELRVRYRREGIERDTLVAVQSYRESIEPSHGSLRELGDGIVYVNPRDFIDEGRAKVTEMLSRARALVVDMRYYPMEMEFSRFVGEWVVTDSMSFRNKCQVYTYPNVSLPGSFSSSQAPDPEWDRSARSRCPVAVLVDNWTQSSGETHVQWMQCSRDVVVVGRQTSGANGNISHIDLPGGIHTCFSGLGWYYNDGVMVQRQGVRIDVEVPRTVAGVITGRDEILDRALEVLHARLTVGK